MKTIFFPFFYHHFGFLRQAFSVCSPGYPGTDTLDQVGLKFIGLSASVSLVLGIKACATTFFDNINLY